MKKNLRLFLVALLCFAPLSYVAPVWASDSDFEVENEDGVELEYHFLDGENGEYVEVCGPNAEWFPSDIDVLNIPEKVYSEMWEKEYTVVGVGENAFESCTFTTVNFPNTITYFLEEAFWNCEYIESIHLPESVIYVGEGAFAESFAATEITLNEGLQYLGDSSFTDNAITSLYIPGTVTYFGSKAFQSCYNLETVIFGEGITSITSEDRILGDDYAVKLMVLPSTLTYIGNYALGITDDELETLVCYAVNPPECESSDKTFDDGEYAATLYVPAGSKEMYESADVWKNFASIVEMASEEDNTFTISSAGYATYYTDVEYVMPAGVTGTTVTGVANTTSGNAEYVLTMPWEYVEGSVVPANTALVLQGAEGTYEYETSSTGAEAPTDNLLVGSTTETTTTGPNGEEEGYIFYELSTGTYGVGFYYGVEGGGAFTSLANKAWLPLGTSTVQNARFLGFGGDDDTTGISSVESAAEGATIKGIYTVQGTHVSNMNQSGLYIVDGKKVIKR